MTARELFEMLRIFDADHPKHEMWNHEVIVRVGVENGPDDEDIHVGGLRSAVIDAGCTEDFALTLDADQEPDDDDSKETGNAE